MNKLIITLLFICYVQGSFAQEYHPEYEDDYIGWKVIYKFKGYTKPLQVDEKKYSAAQLSIADSFANWMQASYQPKGGMGDIRKYLSPKKDIYAERYNEAVPHSYGTNAMTYRFLKRQNDKWVPENNLGISWTIAANEIPLINRLVGINTNKVCLFTIPAFDEEVIAEQPGSLQAAEKRLYDLSACSSLNRFIFYTKPNQGNDEPLSLNVILSKNNRFPFVHVTIGEMLQYAEDAIPVKTGEEKQSVAEQYSTRPNDKDFYTKQITDRYEKVKATIKQLREKYKNRLNEPAYSTYGGFSMTDLQNGRDIFLKTADGTAFNKSYPVYRVDPQLEPLCKTDKPQWIVVKWKGGSMDQSYFKHMHESIVTNFNFDYVYNFFFDPEKVKGKPYTPLHSPVSEDKPVLQEKPVSTKPTESDPSVFFFDDFSTTAPGQKPNGWKSEMNTNAKYATVVSIKGSNQNWLEIKGNSFVIPSGMKKPLPQNFELSFDLAVPRDIPWGAKALELYLCTQNKLNENDGFIKIRFRAGFSGRPGEITVETRFGTAFSSNKTDYPGIGFSNDKELNQVHVKLLKNGEAIQLLFDDNIVADLPKGLPASTLFNWVQFKHSNSDADNQTYFIGNFKIKKR